MRSSSDTRAPWCVPVPTQPLASSEALDARHTPFAVSVTSHRLQPFTEAADLSAAHALIPIRAGAGLGAAALLVPDVAYFGPFWLVGARRQEHCVSPLPGDVRRGVLEMSWLAAASARVRSAVVAYRGALLGSSERAPNRSERLVLLRDGDIVTHENLAWLLAHHPPTAATAVRLADALAHLGLDAPETARRHITPRDVVLRLSAGIERALEHAQCLVGAGVALPARAQVFTTDGRYLGPLEPSDVAPHIHRWQGLVRSFARVVERLAEACRRCGAAANHEVTRGFFHALARHAWDLGRRLSMRAETLARVSTRRDTCAALPVSLGAIDTPRAAFERLRELDVCSTSSPAGGVR